MVNSNSLNYKQEKTSLLAAMERKKDLAKISNEFEYKCLFSSVNYNGGEDERKKGAWLCL